MNQYSVAIETRAGREGRGAMPFARIGEACAFAQSLKRVCKDGELAVVRDTSGDTVASIGPTDCEFWFTGN